ncbi:MAG: zinc-finger domain-containing protein [Rhodospirillaceae bacterium]|nr:zinc-finger domain-containing protein [Rhodospirillales bacterium]
MSVAYAAPDKIETQIVDTATVACDGGTGPLGHPRVYLTFGHAREVVCPYCSRSYQLAEGAKAHGH